MRNITIKAASWLHARQPREEGQTVIEYGLVVAIVSIALALALYGMGDQVIKDVKAAIDASF